MEMNIMLSKIKNEHIALLGVVGIVLELIAFVVSLLLSWFDGYNMSALIIIGRAIQIPFFLICLSDILPPPMLTHRGGGFLFE